MSAHRTVVRAIESYARTTGTPLSPQWTGELGDYQLAEGVDALAGLCGVLGWPHPRRIEGRPRPDQFPLLVFDPAAGWAVARQWDSDSTLALAGERATLPWSADQRFFAVALPDPLAGEHDSAFAVFRRAIARRKQPLVMAGIATVFANLVTLATSLHSMQLYDRVIPLASFDTLAVLTAGVLFALLIDLALRALRALLIERGSRLVEQPHRRGGVEQAVDRHQAALTARHAALDQATEMAALEAIDRQMKPDDILVMVTHKPQLLARFHRIIALAGGKIVRDGPVREVVRELMPRPAAAQPSRPAARPRTGVGAGVGVTSTITRPVPSKEAS